MEMYIVHRWYYYLKGYFVSFNLLVIANATKTNENPGKASLFIHTIFDAKLQIFLYIHIHQA